MDLKPLLIPSEAFTSAKAKWSSYWLVRQVCRYSGHTRSWKKPYLRPC